MDLPLIVSADTTSLQKGTQDLRTFKGEYQATGAAVASSSGQAAKGTAQLAAQTDRLTRDFRTGSRGASEFGRALGNIGADALAGELTVARLGSSMTGLGLAFGVAGVAAATLAQIGLTLLVQWFMQAEEEAKALTKAVDDFEGAANRYVKAADAARVSTAALREEYGLLSTEARAALQALSELALIEAIDLADKIIADSVTAALEDANRNAEQFTYTAGLARKEGYALFAALQALEQADGLAAQAKAAAEVQKAMLAAYGSVQDMPEAVRATYAAMASLVAEAAKVETKARDVGDIFAQFPVLLQNATGWANGLAGAVGNVATNAWNAAVALAEAAQKQATLVGGGRGVGPQGPSADPYGFRAQLERDKASASVGTSGAGSSGGGGGGAQRDAYSEQQVELANRLLAAERERAAVLGGEDMERYAAVQDAINTATAEGTDLTEAQIDAITAQAGAVFDLEKQVESLKDAFDAIEAAAETFGTALGKALGDAVFGIGNFRDAARAAFEDLVRSVLEELGKLAASKIFAMIAGGAFGGGGFSLNLGGLGIPFLAAGGIVSRPTLAVVGEAGPEAVVPLSRGPEFGLGRSAGREPAQVIINNNAPGVTAEATEREDGSIEVLISAAAKATADGVARGTGDLARVLENTYGLRRQGR